MQNQKRKDKKSPWRNCGDIFKIYDGPFSYGEIRLDRPRAKKDGDSYRVYSETFNNGLNSRLKTVIITNKNIPNERTAFQELIIQKTNRKFFIYLFLLKVCCFA